MADAGGDVGRHVLEVDVGHPVRTLLRDGDRVAAADQQVPGVEAQADAAAAQHPFGLLAGLDHGADVGVQGRLEATRGGGHVEPVEIAEEGGPALGVEHRAGVVPLGPGRRREHERGGVRGDETVHGQVDLGERVVVRVVQDDRDELADGGEPVPPEHGRLGLRRLGEEVLRTELGGAEPHLPHLGQDGGRVVLPAPAGHLADPPRDRGTGDAVQNGEADRSHAGVTGDGHGGQA